MKNRQIKFRAWDGKSFVPEHFFVRDGVVYTFEPVGDYMDLVAHKNWVLVEFTGLEDKNGKEIYEGDIIEWRLKQGQEYIQSNDDPTPLRKIIAWNDEEGRFEFRNTKNEGNQSGYTFCKGNFESMAEVIGNIYEKL